MTTTPKHKETAMATAQQAQKMYCLVLASNPYPEVCVAQCDAQGNLVRRPSFSKHRKHYDVSAGYYLPDRRTRTTKVDTYSPHHYCGAYMAEHVSVVDSIPRPWDEAMALANRCPRGTHVGPPLTVACAQALIAAAGQNASHET